MRHTDIRVGDRLKLKAANPYGFGPRGLLVTAITPRPGYSVPFIRCGELVNADGAVSAFKPSDFQGHA